MGPAQRKNPSNTKYLFIVELQMEDTIEKDSFTFCKGQ